MSYGYEMPPRRQPPRSQSGSPALLLLLLVLCVVLGVLLVRQFWPFGHRDGTDPNVNLRVAAPTQKLWQIEENIVSIYSQASKSVVHIYSTGEGSAGSGSGFVWDDDGRVVTNFHVVANSSSFDEDQKKYVTTGQVEVTLPDQRKLRATLVGAYPDKDIAVLYPRGLGGRKPPKIELARSDNLKVGQFTFAIGNPYGLDRSLSFGIISALDRNITTDSGGPPIKNVIQTDAAINPGNSGGPLLNSGGQLIGMTTAIYSRSGASAGIGFAIPSDEINQVATQIINNGRVIRPFLGVHIAPDQLAQQAGVAEGALIWEVVKHSPAAEANLRGTTRGQLGDIIVDIDDTPIKRARDLFSVLGDKKVGDTIKLKYLRDDVRHEVSITLQ
jgi:S1-C subfamily serine protease